MTEALAANESFQNSLANLKGTLRTAFQPILDFIIPILQALINVLNAAIGYVAKFTSWLFGSTVQASSAAAKALYDQTNATKAAGAAAVKAKRQMSGLDEMNTWQNDTSGGGGGAAEPAIKFDGIKKPWANWKFIFPARCWQSARYSLSQAFLFRSALL